MANIWVQLSDTSRVLGLRFEPPPPPDADIWQPHDFPEEHYEDFNLYRLMEGELVYDPPQAWLDEREEARAARELDEALGALPQTLADTDAALCELYEEQEEALASVDAAICELYEMVTGGDG